MIFAIMISVFICSFILTFAVRYIALRLNIIDIPNQRSSHSKPIPRGGGIAVVISFLLALVFALNQQWITSHLFYALTLSGLIIAATGCYDDIYHLKARTRVAIHFAAASFALYCLNGLPILDFGTWQFHLAHVGSLIAIISIVWLTNLYNFMDGIDGLAASEGLFVSLAAAFILWFSGKPHLAFLFCALTASLAGFTILNWPPAKIFLGDVGSGFIGFCLAILGIHSIQQTNLSISFWLILLAVFICDATFTVIARVIAKKPWYAAHREHAYQRLIQAGATHQQTTLAILLLNLTIILPAAIFAMLWPRNSGWIMMAIVMTLYFIWLVIVQSSSLSGKNMHETNSPVA